MTPWTCLSYNSLIIIGKVLIKVIRICREQLNLMECSQRLDRQERTTSLIAAWTGIKSKTPPSIRTNRALFQKLTKSPLLWTSESKVRMTYNLWNRPNTVSHSTKLQLRFTPEGQKITILSTTQTKIKTNNLISNDQSKALLRKWIWWASTSNKKQTIKS